MTIAIIILFILIAIVVIWIESLANTYNQNGRITYENRDKIQDLEERIAELESKK